MKALWRVGGRGEQALSPNPSPTRGEGKDPHPRPLSQGGRGELTLTPGPSPTRGEGSDALTPRTAEGRLTPFSFREKGWG